MCRQLAIQLIQHDARLNPHGLGCGIQSNHLIEIRAVIYNQSPPHRLATLRSPRASGQDRHFFIGCDLDGRNNVFSRSGHHNTKRFNLIRRGIG